MESDEEGPGAGPRMNGAGSGARLMAFLTARLQRLVTADNEMAAKLVAHTLAMLQDQGRTAPAEVEPALLEELTPLTDDEAGTKAFVAELLDVLREGQWGDQPARRGRSPAASEGEEVDDDQAAMENALKGEL